MEKTVRILLAHLLLLLSSLLIFLFFETGLLCIALTVLEPTVDEARLKLIEIHLPVLPSAGIKGLVLSEVLLTVAPPGSRATPPCSSVTFRTVAPADQPSLSALCVLPRLGYHLLFSFYEREQEAVQLQSLALCVARFS